MNIGVCGDWINVPFEINRQLRFKSFLSRFKLLSGTILDGNSGQDGLEYVALAAIILVVLVVVGRMIAQKLFVGGIAATSW